MRETLQSLTRGLFDDGGLRVIFDHARNVIVATLFVATGLEAVKRSDSLTILGTLDVAQAGYVVAAVGGVLVALNFIDGLRRLSQNRRHRAWQIALVVLYLFFSIRAVQLIIVMRSQQC